MKNQNDYFLSQEEYQELKTFILNNFGFNIGSYLRVGDEVGKLLLKHQILRFNNYFALCLKPENNKMLSELVSSLSNHYTFFNRESYQLRFLLMEGFANLLKDKSHLDFLSIGCSTGEESYSLALAYQNYCFKNNQIASYEIQGIDIADFVLEQAIKGLYRSETLRYLPSEDIQKYFIKRDTLFEINSEIKSKCLFNNIDFHYFESNKKYDIILCRNVLLYYNVNTVQIFVNKLINLLNIGGYLMFGGAEMIPVDEKKLKYVTQAVFQKVEK
ncbi:MAG: hypothetical protein LBM99_03985 [Bacillales bacterium]|jgi:chemotaxis protein methyltransferase CheR|nr:hypothetical protein [Bacillales bacterium]